MQSSCQRMGGVSKQKIENSYQSEAIKKGDGISTINSGVYVFLLQLLLLRSVKIK